jgi:hypothetical protein
VDGWEDLNEYVTVYNLEVEGDHTYFVGETGWGFSVWAHNANKACPPAVVPTRTPAQIRADNIARGIPESQLGGSGKPRIRSRDFPTRKKAFEAARQRGKRAPILNANDIGQPPHFHPVDAGGVKLSPSEHFNFPSSQA